MIAVEVHVRVEAPGRERDEVAEGIGCRGIRLGPAGPAHAAAAHDRAEVGQPELGALLDRAGQRLDLARLREGDELFRSHVGQVDRRVRLNRHQDGHRDRDGHADGGNDGAGSEPGRPRATWAHASQATPARIGRARSGANSQPGRAHARIATPLPGVTSGASVGGIRM
ncbi:hypothetical protein GCM10025870_20830 [Agromyces marinus]|uniref:Uncharacterized protein n=1 Tax=Agromyces marinus TaxID=1389020 RepID=A0ABN6YGE8_9MICO|nr:hypothetical protein GCM10025870_20830 [Agromyces marinus]